MDRRILGRTGLAVTQLGYGSMGLRGPRTWGVRAVAPGELIGPAVPRQLVVPGIPNLKFGI